MSALQHLADAIDGLIKTADFLDFETWIDALELVHKSLGSFIREQRELGDG